MRKIVLAVVIGSSIAGGIAIAEDRPEPGSLQARLERIEQAIARLEQKLSTRGDSSGMMEGCRDMMGGGMMGRSRRSAPNDQWGQRR